ncbi:MAG: flavodoxin family protein [Treponema sp.]|nr:flavodoxin family protein [Treponema sp.]
MKLIISDIKSFEPNVTGDYYLICPEEGKDIHHCIGCFGCWLKDPGKCLINDGFEFQGARFGAADEIILISENCFGSVSPFIKKNLDRALACVHPDFKIINGELHHKARYHNKPKISWHIYAAENDVISDAEKETMNGILEANVLNYHAKSAGVHVYASQADFLREVTL